MGIEKTYIMLKPDCVKRGLMGEVISRIERKGYKIVDAKMMNLDEAILKEHYAHLADKPFFPEIVSFMTSGDFAHSTSENLIHGSDSLENAEIEIKRFFG